MGLPIHAVTLPRALSGQSNGKLPASILTTSAGQASGPTVTLVTAAAVAWRALCAAALAAGHTLKATSAGDSYRSYAAQESLFRARYSTSPISGRPTKVWLGRTWWLKPGMATAAVPSTSNHGWGLAVDIGEERDGDSGTEAIDAGTVAWLTANAGKYGWSAELQSEPWHWRYFAGDNPPAAVSAGGDDDVPVDDIRAYTLETVLTIRQVSATLAAVAKKVDLDPAELEQIRTAAAEGVKSVVPLITDAILAKLPAGAMTRDDVEQAVRDAFSGGLAPE